MDLRRWFLITLVLCACGWPAPRPACAQMLSKRLVRLYDFEEPANLEPVPMGWIRVDDREGFPAYNKAAFDGTVSFAGDRCVQLPTLGGSTMLVLPAGDVPAVGISDYVVAARVRTAGLTHARAQLSAVFYAGHETPIEESRVSSELLQTQGGWELVHVALYGKYPQATHISLELSLLQPEQYEPPSLSEHRPRLQDISGAAWFDEVAVYLAPRIELTTGAPGNVVIAPESPVLSMTIHDVARESLRGSARVLDLQGEPAAVSEFDLVRFGKEMRWDPQLERYGWYRMVLELHNSEQLVASESIWFAYLPPDGPASGEKERFGIIAEAVGELDMDLLPMLLDELNSGSVWLPAWDRNLTLAALSDYFTEPEPAIQELLYQHVRITFVLHRLPDELARQARLEATNLLDLLRLGESTYADYLDPVLVKYGQQSSRWQIGRTGDEDAFFAADLPELSQRFHNKTQQFVPGPVVMLPWSLQQLPRPEIDTPAGWTVSVPWGLPLDTIAGTLVNWTGNPENCFVLETPDPEVFSSHAAVVSMVKRAVIAWMLEAPCLAIRQPWQVRGEIRPQLMPRPEFAAWRQLSRRLTGKRVLSSYPVVKGVRAFILMDPEDRAAKGTIIAWNESAPPEQAVIEMFLGNGEVRVVDVFGNADPAQCDARGGHVIPLTPDPVFIENVDVNLALFRARFGLHPQFIQSTYDEHYHYLELENPWPVTISGELLIVEPKRWDFSPRHHIFSVPPGQRIRLPLTLTFPPSELAGWRTIAAEVTLITAEPLKFRIEQAVELGLKKVLLTPSVQVSGEDLVVMLQVTNRSAEAGDYKAYISHPEYGKLYRPVGELQPGESRMIYIQLPGGTTRLAGERILTGLVEVDGPGRLNMAVQAP
ncbi:MAG: hypothetical protein ACF8NJ_04425 [Phycisphaerales bacterium JB038]